MPRERNPKLQKQVDRAVRKLGNAVVQKKLQSDEGLRPQALARLAGFETGSYEYKLVVEQAGLSADGHGRGTTYRKK